MDYFQVFILSLVEGLTEFLPVSSTGHLILTSALLGIQDDGFIKAFKIIIQFGAIASVLVIYWRRFLPNLEFYKKLFIACLPAAVIGFALKDKIDVVLDSVWLVGITTLLGGFILIGSDSYFEKRGKSVNEISALTYKDSLKLGFIQCLALLPGTSRSGATIIGGLFLGLNRKAAAEFSFFLAVPTLTGAALIKTIHIAKTIQPGQWSLLITGTVLSFIFAIVSVKFMISLVTRYGFKYFGIYRVVLGLYILLFAPKGGA